MADRRINHVANPNRALVPYNPSAQVPKNSAVVLAEKAVKKPIRVTNDVRPLPRQIPRSQLRNKYAEIEKMQECSLRLLKARAAPFSVMKAMPCNTSATATNTIRFSTFLRVAGVVGAGGTGFAALSTITGAANDKEACATSGLAYAGTDIQTGAAGVTLSPMNGSFFDSADLTTKAIRIRRVACGVQIIPTTAAYLAQGYFQTWSATSDVRQTSISNANLQGDRTVPVSTYAANTKFLNTWTPSSADDENFNSSTGVFTDVGAGGADLAVVWLGANAGDTFIAEYICYYEAESYQLYSGLALPSEHDPKGSSMVNTTMAQIVRNHISVPASSNEGFFDRAWNTLKQGAVDLAESALPGLLQKGASALISLL